LGNVVTMPSFSEIDFRRTPVTLIIAAIAVALEIVSTLDPARREFYYMDLNLGLLSTVWQGEFWQPFTTTLLHGNLIHVLFNVSWLVVFGQVLEPRFGSFRYLGLFVLLAYVSMLPEFIVQNYRTPVDKQVGCVGLSGIMYGLFGMVWIGRRWNPEFYAICDRQTVQLMIGWLFLCIVLTYADLMPVANIAHGAGLAFGVVFGLAAFDRAHRIGWTLLAAAATLAVLSTLIACPGHAGYEFTQRQRHVRQLLDQMHQDPPKR